MAAQVSYFITLRCCNVKNKQETTLRKLILVFLFITWLIPSYIYSFLILLVFWCPKRAEVWNYVCLYKLIIIVTKFPFTLSAFFFLHYLICGWVINIKEENKERNKRIYLLIAPIFLLQLPMSMITYFLRMVLWLTRKESSLELRYNT